MRIVLVNQFYPPDTAPTGRYLHDLAVALARRGHAVTALASRAAYNADARFPRRSVQDGVTVRRVGGLNLGRHRLFLKGMEYAAFMALTGALLARLRADFVLTLTTPPYLGALARLSRRGGSPYANWVMDLYPDVLTAHGRLNPDGWLGRRLASLARYTFDGGRFAVALAPDMAARMTRYVPRGRIETLPLWPPTGLRADPAAAIALRAERGWNATDTVFMYSGNMGLGHRFGEFLQAARSSDASVRWALAGDGKRRAELETFAATHPETRLEWLPAVTHERLGAHLLSADVHMMSLDKRWEGCMIPSKLQAVCGVGRPILFVGSATASPARWIREYEAGWIVAADDHAGMSHAVSEARDPAERTRRGQGAARLAREMFDRRTNLNRLCALIESEVGHAV